MPLGHRTQYFIVDFHLQNSGLCDHVIKHCLLPVSFPFHASISLSPKRSSHEHIFNMPRKKIKLDHPDDPERVEAYIEEKARRSESAALRKFLREIPKPTSLPLLKDFKLDGRTQIMAAAIHIRGEIAETPCNNCKTGSGPFLHCVYMTGYDDLTKLCCTNCQFNLCTEKGYSSKRAVKLCSFATWHTPYMLLYEQRLYEEMRNLIPDTFAAEDQDDMVKAADTCSISLCKAALATMALKMSSSLGYVCAHQV